MVEGGVTGVVIRAFHPEALACQCIWPDGSTCALVGPKNGLFQRFFPERSLPQRYRLRFSFVDGSRVERGDPYRFLPGLGPMDLHLFNEGNHRLLWRVLGAHPRTLDDEHGVSFAVWAPNALHVSVVGEFNTWDPRQLPMRMLGSSGVFELFVPGIMAGSLYKFAVFGRDGSVRLKADPFGFAFEQPPQTASKVITDSSYAWNDGEWLATRAHTDPARCPMVIYEVHLGSWARVPEQDNRWLSYREIAPQLVAHVRSIGATHVELMPISEHPFYGSWGYQVTGYFAPTARYGDADDLRFLVDTCHRAGIGVILDWVPAHFPRDDFALARFDGTALYEHEDTRLGEHPDWGTLIFNFGRTEVRNFLIASALYWLQEFHVDGLRVDAVASMLYRDYSRHAGEWLPNQFGGRENIEAIEFLRQLNTVLAHECPGCMTIAEESTAWDGVTRSVDHGGLGFTFKWNMGWMHDTLSYFATDAVHRRWHHDQITFSMIYEYHERFIMPMSHDEVVHGKRSLLARMSGDTWQKFANLRTLLAYMYTRPGKKLLFMGTELAPWNEWQHDHSLDWHLREQPLHGQFECYVRELGELYKSVPCLWRSDHEPSGFTWIEVGDRDNSVLSYVRRTGDQHALVILNMTPVPRERYRVGVPSPGNYRCVLCSDHSSWGGSAYPIATYVETDDVPCHGHANSLVLELPPLACLMYLPEAFVPSRCKQAG